MTCVQKGRRNWKTMPMVGVVMGLVRLIVGRGYESGRTEGKGCREGGLDWYRNHGDIQDFEKMHTKWFLGWN